MSPNDPVGPNDPVDVGRRTALLVVVSGGIAVAVGPFVRGVLPSDRLRLAAPEVTVDARRFTLRTTVDGGARAGTRLRVWCTLTSATEAGAGAGWSSPVTSVALEPGGTPILLDAIPSVPPGTYRLDLWLHAKRRTRFIHHDHRRVTIDLTRR